MYSLPSIVQESRIGVRVNSLKTFLNIFYKLIVYIYWVDYTSKLEKIRKHIMAVVIQRMSETDLIDKSHETLSSLSSTSDSEESCSSIEVVPEIEMNGQSLRLSFRKLAQKRNLLVEDLNNEPTRGAKSPSIQPDICPSFALSFESTSSSQVSDLDTRTGFNIRSATDFNLQLGSIISPLPSDKETSVKVSLRPKNSFELNLAPIDPDDLSRQILSDSKDLLMIDCRSFMKYNGNHILGALNACCTNPTIKKRFSDGKIGVLELISGVENKNIFQEVTSSETCLIVIYDDESVTLGDSNCLEIIAARITILGHRVKFLKGGIKDFLVNYSHLCSQPVVVERPLLYSPTSPYVDAAIDSTTMTEVLPYLYLGNEKDAANMERLVEQKITHILNVSATIPLFCEQKMPGSFQYLRLPASDSGSQNIKQYFEAAINFIETARQTDGKVLVHCQAGVSRSPTITIAYLISRFGRSSLDAFGEVKSKRVIVSPNINFMGQLLEFESWSKGNL